MEADIGVGMADERTVMRHLEAAEPDVIARTEGVDVEALAGARVAEPGGEEGLGAGEVVHRGHLEIVLAALDESDRQTGALEDRGVVRKRLARRRAVRRQDLGEAETLRRL